MSDYGPLTNAITLAVATGITVAISQAIKAWKERAEKRRHRLDLDHDGHVDRQIYAVLNRCRDKTGAQRIHVSKLRNGTAYADDSQVWHYDRTHEVDRVGVSNEASKYRDVLTSSVIEEMALVRESGPSLRRVDSLPRGRFKYLCESGGVVWVARAKIQKNGGTVAFIGADFDTVEEPPNKCEAIVEAAYEIGQILTSS